MRKYFVKYITYYLQIFIIAAIIFPVTIFIPCEETSGQKVKSEKPLSEKSQGELYFDNGEVLYDAGKLDSAIISFTNAANYFKKNQNWERFIKTLTETGHCYRRKGDFKKAMQYVSESEIEAGKYFKPQNLIYSDILHLKGTLTASSGDHKGSIQYFKKSIQIKILNKGDKDTSLSTSYNNLGNTYFYLGEYDNALSYYKKAISIAHNRIVYESPDVALFNLSIAIIYSIKGDFDNAKFHYSESLRIGKKVFSEDDDDLARILMNTGTFFNQLGRYETALSALNAAKDVFIKKFNDQYYELGYIYTNIGKIYLSKGDNDKASDFYNRALAVFMANYDKNHPEIASALMNYGFCFYEKQEYDKALDLYYKSIAIKSAENSITRIRTYRNIAQCLEKKQDTIGAEKYYDKAIDLSIQLFGKDHYEVGNCYFAKGDFLMRIGKKESSLEYYNRTLTIYIKTFGKKHQDVSQCLTNIGNYYYDTRHYLLALKYYQNALIAINSRFNNQDIYTNPDISNTLLEQNQVRTLRKKASAFAKYWKESHSTKDLNAALATYIKTIDLLDKIRAGYSQNSQLSLGEKASNIYSEAIRVALTLDSITGGKGNYKEKAFELAEKSKAAVLLSAIRGIEAKDFGKIPKALENTETEVKKEIALYNKLVYEEELKEQPSEEKITIWKNKLLSLKQQEEALERFLIKNYPAYFALKYDPKVLNIKELQSNLENNQTMIEYTYSDSSIIIFTISGNQFNISEVRIDSSFKKILKTFTSSISGNSFSTIGMKEFYKYIHSAFVLYNILIKPVEPYISGDRLIIVPDGILSYIPFEALISSLPEDDRLEYRKKAYLIEKYAISYSYSATLLYSETNKKRAHHEILAFAPEYENKFVSTDTNFKKSEDIKNMLTPLPGAITEVYSINKYLKTDVYSASSATEKKFKEIAGDYDIIHLAMHTIIDDKNPMYSKLAFSQTNNTDEDGYLNTYEIFNMDLNARLAVLSACNTGYGKLQDGEGIMSLARGFIYAGCPSILMTLWPVEDKSGSELMTSFYKYLSQGLPKDQALRKAKLEHLAKADQLKAHPYFWSGYVNIGNTEPLINKNHIWNNTTILIIVILVILFISTIYLLAKKRKKQAKRNITIKSKV